MRIAIVDNERQDCATLSEMLAERLSQTAFIDVYDSGNHFLDSEVHYDLVFLDIVMDGLDGIETARRLAGMGHGLSDRFFDEFERICVGCLPGTSI